MIYTVIRARTPLKCGIQLRRQLSTSTPLASSPVKHVLSLADLSLAQITSLISKAAEFKSAYRASLLKENKFNRGEVERISKYDTLDGKSIALMFSKRSTRTRVASETSLKLLGAHPMFLGSSDIQLGVNESLYDSAKVIGSMCNGIFARVGDHSEVETLAQHAGVPVINALSSLYHPTQILADLLTLQETYSPDTPSTLEGLRGLTVSWIGDANNIVNDMIVAYPRLGINLQIASPASAEYTYDQRVLDTYESGIKELGGKNVGQLQFYHDPTAAVKNADVLVTDTWISMGQEAEKERRLKDFEGFQVTEKLGTQGGAKKDWKFMHCLPRKAQEVDDEVFCGPRSLVFPEAENRKWTIMALFDAFYSGRGI